MLHQARTLYAFESGMFEQSRGLSLSLCEPAPDRGNPILAAGPPDGPDGGKICYPGSVAPWNGGYGMWYQAEDRAHRLTRCHASSSDGMVWQRRGAVASADFHEIGNSFNVWSEDGRLLSPLTALESLRPEQIADPRRRALAEQQMAGGGRRGITAFTGVASSGDGVHWTVPGRMPAIPMKLEVPRLYRFQGRYLMNAQTNGAWFDPPHPASRVVVFFSSDDLLAWRMHPTCMVNTSLASQAGQTHCGIIPIKCIDDRLLIGLGGRFDDAGELTDQHFDITLLHSYDGLDWRPVAPAHEHRSWIRRGRQGEWDFGGVVGMGLVEHGDEAAVYYHGTAIGNCSHAFPLYDPGPCAVGRACFPRDRFACLQPTVGWKAYAMTGGDGASGELTTRPLAMAAGGPISLNVELPDRATVGVEALAPDGGVLATARLPHGGTAVPVPFTRPLGTGPVRLRITLAGGMAPDAVPRLYAIGY